MVTDFENKIANWFGARHAVAVDCCTHGIELCLRYTSAPRIHVPKHTYISIPFLSDKLGIDITWRDEDWKDYYYLTDNIVDAAVLWREGSYVPGTFMCLSFQFQKHLSLGRGGMILTDNKKAYESLKKMSYDGRIQNVPWQEQDINSMGYHYYMTPETAAKGLEKLADAINTKPRKWKILDWPDLTKMIVVSK